MFRDGVIHRGFQQSIDFLSDTFGVRRLVGALFLYFRDLLELKSGDKSPHSKVYRGVLFPANSLALEICAVIVFNSSEPAGKSLSNFCHCSMAF